MLIRILNDYIKKLLQIALAVFMGLMIIAVVWQVFTRYVMHDPSGFTDELSRYLLIWVGILGGAYTFVINRHLSLELLASKLSHRGQRGMSIVVNFFIILFAAVAFIYGGSVLVSSTLAHGQISPGIAIAGHHLLIGYVYLVVPAAGILICYFGLLDMISAFIELCHPRIPTALEGQNK